MNHNNKLTFWQYLLKYERFFTGALVLGIVVMLGLVIAAFAYPGYELTTTLQICTAGFIGVYGLSGFKLYQSYRDYLNGTSR